MDNECVGLDVCRDYPYLSLGRSQCLDNQIRICTDASLRHANNALRAAKISLCFTAIAVLLLAVSIVVGTMT